jgi:hypothetical protein
MLNMYDYFNHSPKRHLQFQIFIQTLKTKGNKILKIIKTRCISMFDPLKMIMAEHHPLLVVMQVDYSTIRVAKVFLSP